MNENHIFKNSSLQEGNGMKKNVVIILGNGFDLDLKLKTSYKDFLESKIFDDYFVSILYDEKA